ncbi:MAG: 1,4-alpha-glucan branching protein GlgB [Synergistaceae bacterium]|nr:1,4-alpha-glucan branching protein GlgB [Synergistaceae bacterium]
MAIGKVRYDISIVTDYDIFLLKQGTHYSIYQKFGAHIIEHDGEKGTYFAVWAPNAKKVSVIGGFNDWNIASHPLSSRWDDSGVWEGFIPGVGKWDLYKYHIESNFNGYIADKGDPIAFVWEIAPKTASIVHPLDYTWKDGEWMANRYKYTALNKPWSIYEVHLGSWRRDWTTGNSLSYKELADQLSGYVAEMGFTAVEFLPVMEHPFYGSWGYQTLGFFSPTSRYGTPEDFMYLVDRLHQRGIAVILDWVPSHFPGDDYGLALFDGTCLYEHSDPRKGFHPDWKSHIFNYSRNEVRSFIISSAVFWLDKYHADGLRIDAVASMLYLNYSRKDGEWIPNVHGGKENLEAMSLLRDLNKEIYGRFPDVQTIAEESTAWPMVTKPVHVGGLGFGMKWNMGWMNDILGYMRKDPVHRSYLHNQLTFSIWYAFSENFLLALSHDEIVYGKGSLLDKMSGDWWQKRANLRLLYGFMYAHPGKKLLFMGAEFGQGREWNHDGALEWNLLRYPEHQELHKWMLDLNNVLKEYPPLYECDFEQSGFEWIDCGDWQQSIIMFIRKSKTPGEYILAVCNFTPIPRGHYRVGVPAFGSWKEILNSNASIYGGSGMGNSGGMVAEPVPAHGNQFSLPLCIPPLSITLFYRTPEQ